jgi:hypothetical protein
MANTVITSLAELDKHVKSGASIRFRDMNGARIPCIIKKIDAEAVEVKFPSGIDLCLRSDDVGLGEKDPTNMWFLVS